MVTAPSRERLDISGRPLSAPLRNTRRVAQLMVGHFVEHIFSCGTPPGDFVRGEVTTVTSHCLEFAVAVLDGADRPTQLARLEQAAAGWAREDIPLEIILHTVHTGFTVGLDLIATKGIVTGELEGPDFDTLAAGFTLVLGMLDSIVTAVTMAYIREMRVVAGEHHTAAQTLTSALISGRPASVSARQCGIEVAEEYWVLAVQIPAHPDEADPNVSGEIVARRKLRRVQAELARRCGRHALALLSTGGGTLLLPAPLFEAATIDEIVAGLAEAGRVPITAAVVEAPPSEIPGAVDRAHGLLDTVVRLGSPSGLYRHEEVALEFQLSRPGPARDALAAVLDPLDEHPELLETLAIHFANNFNRQRTAEQMKVHPNTIDHRLRRIAHITGHDPAGGDGAWKLHSAMTARGARPNTP
nr:helix-turn-helix domain-containing protein [Nocardia bovistercoris]